MDHYLRLTDPQRVAQESWRVSGKSLGHISCGDMLHSRLLFFLHCNALHKLWPPAMCICKHVQMQHAYIPFTWPFLFRPRRYAEVVRGMACGQWVLVFQHLCDSASANFGIHQDGSSEVDDIQSDLWKVQVRRCRNMHHRREEKKSSVSRNADQTTPWLPQSWWNSSQTNLNGIA